MDPVELAHLLRRTEYVARPERVAALAAATRAEAVDDVLNVGPTPVPIPPGLDHDVRVVGCHVVQELAMEAFVVSIGLEVDLDVGLTGKERAQAWAIERMIENQLGWVSSYFRFLEPALLVVRERVVNGLGHGREFSKGGEERGRACPSDRTRIGSSSLFAGPFVN